MQLNQSTPPPLQVKSPAPRSLMAILAHPDDESFGMGGTLAIYAHNSADVHLLCATRGEVGEVSPDMMHGFKTIAELRESELRCAAGMLGLRSVSFLGYRDSGMPGTEHNYHPQALIQANMEEVVLKIVTHIRKARPQIIITFDPIGGYRHPDHIFIHKAAVRAFYAAADTSIQTPGFDPYQPQKLYYHTINKTMLKIWVRLLPLFRQDPHNWGKNKDIDLVSIIAEDFPTHARIDYRPVAELRAAAAACHASQGGKSMNRGIQGITMKLLGSKETFMRASPPPQKGHIETDLFEGVILT